MNTEIIQFQPRIAEIIAFKNFNFTSLIGIKMNFYSLVSGFKIPLLIDKYYDLKFNILFNSSQLALLAIEKIAEQIIQIQFLQMKYKRTQNI